MSSYRYVILNAFLCFLALLLAFENYQAWDLSAGPHPVHRPVSGKRESGNAISPPAAPAAAPASIDSFQVISEKNIFSPERKDFPAAPAVADAPKPVVRPQVVLYGVVIAGDYESATITTPGRLLRKGERESLTIKVGDRIGEYRLAKILPDRIALEASGDTFDVLLYDSRHPKRRTEVRTPELRTPAAAVAGGQLAPPSPSDGTQPAVSAHGEQSGAKPVRPQLPPPLPFNKFTFQLGNSAPPARGAVSPAGPVTK